MRLKTAARSAKCLTILVFLVLAGSVLQAGERAFVLETRHGIAMHGEPELPPDFAHFPYVNPDAPKGGRIAYGLLGSFDSLNPFVVKGATTTARGLRDGTFGDNVFESLMARSAAEPFTLYGLIADSVRTPEDRSWVEFTINPLARFSDGKPVTVDDVIFSFELLRDKGRPNFQAAYGQVANVERVGERGVRFTFKIDDRELPLILALMPVLPKHAVDRETFDNTTLKPPIASGPYLVAEVKPPSRIVLRKNPDYWGKDLPAKRGFDNYDTIVIDYFRDENSRFEAFKKGLFDVYPDNDPSHWDSAYAIPAVKDGRIVREELSPVPPPGMLGLIFNTRRPVFADIRVRRALTVLFDFEWINANLFHGIYKRNASYFQDTEGAAAGRPASERERALLAPFPKAVAEDVLNGTWTPPVSDGSGRDRKQLQTAVTMLAEAGFALRGTRMVRTATGEPFAFEFLVNTRENERIALAYQRTLERVGIDMGIRLVDSSQYQGRVTTFDYDMILGGWGGTLSPGNEQNNRWSAISAEREGSFNFAGARESAIDAMISALLAASSREDFVAATRALDRVLISGHYCVPLFYLPKSRVARWDRIKHPGIVPISGYQLTTWWAEPASD
jgi:peptide/nickel transport system substrate-binding protein